MTAIAMTPATSSIGRSCGSTEIREWASKRRRSCRTASTGPRVPEGVRRRPGRASSGGCGHDRRDALQRLLLQLVEGAVLVGTDPRAERDEERADPDLGDQTRVGAVHAALDEGG